MIRRGGNKAGATISRHSITIYELSGGRNICPASKGEREILKNVTIIMTMTAPKGNPLIIHNFSTSASPVCHLKLFLQPSPNTEGDKNTSHKHLLCLFERHICIYVISQQVTNCLETFY